MPIKLGFPKLKKKKEKRRKEKKKSERRGEERKKLGRINEETKGEKLQCPMREERQKEKFKVVRESLITESLKHQHFHGVKVKVTKYYRQAVKRNMRRKEKSSAV